MEKAEKAERNIAEASDFPEPLLSVLRQAVAERATDVHLDPGDTGKLVRFRVDGVIHEKPAVPLALCHKLLNQIKVYCNLDIAKAFSPLEGLLTFRDHGMTHDIRVTIVPVGAREAVHLRFSSAASRSLDLGALGFDPEEIEAIKTLLAVPAGLVLVGGATGAGKSTTLYALAEMLDLEKRIAVSIEDPVEFRLPYIRQLQVNEFHKVTMDTGLRVLLRMNPDVILVGEIRDDESAITAGRAALTGCLVMATIHARNALSAADALHQLAVPRHVVGASLRLIILQELIRRACPACAKPATPTRAQLALFRRHKLPPPDKVVTEVGCRRCSGYGYLGRVGVFEVTPVSRELGQLIGSTVNQADLREPFEKATFQSLASNALQKAAEHVTTIEEATQFCLGREEFLPPAPVQTRRRKAQGSAR
jgi:type II secretory ATPase GspE/PulE/Tfp pilus assembly ATPase PilB-like protein